MSDAQTDPRDLEGRVVADRYLLEERHRSGGFGVVYLARQQLLGDSRRRVALKLSKRTGLTPDSAKELMADVLLLATVMDEITDPEARRHLVHVYDAGIDPALDRRGFLAMEFVPGGTTLASRFASLERTPEPQLRTWAVQICRALRALHARVPPLLHRDLKPDNVLLGPDNAVRLVDFGLAAELLRLGHVPGVAGTLAYMAPETSQGESVPASDVYSLGVLLYEGLTGRHPFNDLIPPARLPEASHRGWLYDHKKRYHVTPPSALNNTVTPALDAVVLGCLSFRVGDRFRDAGELLQALTERPRTTRSRAEAALEDAERLRAGGDLDGARTVLERGLAASTIPDAHRFLLHHKLGEVLSEAGEHLEAARQLAGAWELTEHRAFLRTGDERAALLEQTAESCRRAGNTFQARNYERLRDRVLGPGETASR